MSDETQRTKVAQQLLPINGPLGDVTTVPSEITVMDTNGNGFRIREGDTTALFETSVGFAMTQTQVQQEALKQMSTAEMLATKAANLISKAQDQIIFTGKKTFEGLPW